MGKDILEKLQAFVEEHKEELDFTMIVLKFQHILEEKDEEIKKLKKEVESLRKKVKEETELELADENANPIILKAPIRECGLPLYVANALWFGPKGFDTLGEVVKFTRKDLLGLRGFGKKRLAVLESFLEKNGLKLAEE